MLQILLSCYAEIMLRLVVNFVVVVVVLLLLVVVEV